MVKKIFIITFKLCFLFLFIKSFNITNHYFLNEIALMQMNNSTDSTMWIQLYQELNPLRYVIYAMIVILLFSDDISNLVKFIKNKIK